MRFSREDWTALSRLLDEALDLPEHERAAWIAAQRATHPALAAELESMLNHEHTIDSAGFLSERQAAELPRWSTLAGQTLGAYIIERALGQGGMGSVWLARRNDGRFEGVAAIKFLSLAVAGPAGEERFRREGSALARLTHPNIARLLDAGVSQIGLPYLVLEYVEGMPIDAWCDSHMLSVEGRLRLFEQVLDAVAHAHANFIVHRDLKPANILVTADGTVKLLDFGIAKLLEQGSDASSGLTGTHEAVFTYRYAAPEQLRNEPITTATDVYSCGVILYELLAGKHPTSAEAHTPAEHVVAVLDTESSPLAHALAPSGSHTREDVARLAAARDSSPERLRRVFAGDLDNIVAKALKKNPAERYPTVGALAGDVRHYLAHEPVSARADSLGYRARKFVRRHRVPVAAAALFAGALVLAAVREARLRSRAESEARKAVAVEQYLVSIFGAADPFAVTADTTGNVTARELLDRGAERIDTSLADQPDVRAELRGALGRVYANLGIYGKATSELRRSLAERRALYRSDNASLAEAMDQLGEVLMREDSLAESDTLLRDALAMRRRLFGSADEATAQSLDHLAQLEQNKDAFTAAEPLFREALEIRRALRGDSDLTVATSRDNLGLLLHAKGANTEAIAQFHQALAIRTRRLGVDHPSTAETMHDLAQAEENLGLYTDAERDYRGALAIERKTLGNVHRSVAFTLNDLGQMMFKRRRLDEAESLLREALSTNRSLFGENHDAVTANLSNLAIVVRERGNFDEAERLLEQALAIDRTLYGEEHINVGFDLNEMAVVLRLEGRPDSAVTIMRPALASTRRLVGDSAASTLTMMINLGRALAEARRYAEAEPLLRKALAGLDTNNADVQMAIIPGRIGLGRVLIATGRAREALPVLESSVAMSTKRSGADHWRTGEADMVLANCLMALGDYEKAAEPLRHGSEVLEKERRAHPGLAREAESANLAFTRQHVRS